MTGVYVINALLRLDTLSASADVRRDDRQASIAAMWNPATKQAWGVAAEHRRVNTHNRSNCLTSKGLAVTIGRCSSRLFASVIASRRAHDAALQCLGRQ